MVELLPIDTTLRGGEQSPALIPGFGRRLEIALAEDRAGVDVVDFASSADLQMRAPVCSRRSAAGTPAA